jgi:hypothetical protein
MIAKQNIIFLSYSTKNRDFVLKLRDALEELQYSTWMDNHHLKGGDEWVKEIELNLQNSKALIVVVSKESNDSAWVKRETICAEQLKIKQIPVVFDDSTRC